MRLCDTAHAVKPTVEERLKRTGQITAARRRRGMQQKKVVGVSNGSRRPGLPSERLFDIADARRIVGGGRNMSRRRREGRREDSVALG